MYSKYKVWVIKKQICFKDSEVLELLIVLTTAFLNKMKRDHTTKTLMQMSGCPSKISPDTSPTPFTTPILRCLYLATQSLFAYEHTI
jgi:hypothetical protein